MSVEREKLLQMYYDMLRIRYFEEKVDELFARGYVHGTCHLYMGEEAVAVGAVAALEEKDYITSTHRGHGHCLAKGADIKKMMAEILGRKTGYCKGKGGSMHIADFSSGNLGANGVVGGGIPIAVGAALALKYKGRKEIVLCFFGDGAANQGCFHESLNLAAIWKLPVVFLCENNKYGMSLDVSKACAGETIAQRAASYAMEGASVDGNDVLAVRDAMKEAADRTRAGKGPVLIEAETYRWKGHSKSDRNLYRTKEEISLWRSKCPIKRLHEKLTEKMKISTEEKLAELQAAAGSEVEEAVNFAMESPEPETSEAFTDVYA